MITQGNITLGQRVAAPTPKFFKTLRTIGIVLGSVGVAVLAAPVALPAIVGTVAGILVTGGTVAGIVSSLPVDFEKLKQQGK